MYRVNPTTRVAEPVSAIYDPVAKTLTAQSYELSEWFWGTRTPDNTADGCVKVDNGSSSIWRTVVTQTYTMKYPNTNNSFTGASATWAKQGTIGWTSASDWYLPQGSYQMCVEGDVNGVSKHSAPIPVEISKPWRYDAPVCTSLGISNVVLDRTGRCEQSPVATPSVGTGALQISLSWYSAVEVDLDLHVVEPDGETVYYDNLLSASGGRLDRDNKCRDYINGQSENILLDRTQGRPVRDQGAPVLQLLDGNDLHALQRASREQGRDHHLHRHGHAVRHGPDHADDDHGQLISHSGIRPSTEGRMCQSRPALSGALSLDLTPGP